ncbi:hypothetical protein AM592_13420 [Bacillus gobiensis]|uniref:Uncharacterized protein n=1 Tax=Bacillus gobiensis TaxID=1441095 RepID=A0A0M4GAC1_9BACI|nr:hypothetical protein AM592_13420 [Bacillus gobiensis]
MSFQFQIVFHNSGTTSLTFPVREVNTAYVDSGSRLENEDPSFFSVKLPIAKVYPPDSSLV